MKPKIITLFILFIAFSVSVFSQTAWDGYRKKLTDEHKYISFASIYGLNGQIYSAPADAKTSVDEAKALLNILANPAKAANTTVTINKVKYTITKADKTNIFGRTGTGAWFEVMKTKQVILVAVGRDPNIQDAVKELGAWLVKNGS